jgi:segregation and condensation protein B
VSEEETPLSPELSIPTEGPALKHIVEALVFASQKPISAKEISVALRGAADAAKDNPMLAAFAKAKENEIIEAVDSLSADYAAAGHAFEIRETVAGWQLVSAPSFAPWLRQLFPESKPARLSAPALETLAIIAYRQPVTRADIEAVRGVAVDGVMQTLLDRQLIRIAGRAEIPGRPLLYDTTSHFMEHFGIRNLNDLPNATELRRAAEAIVAANTEAQPAEAEVQEEAPASESTAVEAPVGEEPAEIPADEAVSEEPVVETEETPAEETAGISEDEEAQPQT